MGEQEAEVLTRKIQDSLTRARSRLARLQTTHTSLVIGSLATGGLSTLLAGLSAANGQALLGTGDPGWRITCALAAVLTFAGTLATGAMQQLKISEELAQARTCAGRLAALDLALTVNRQPVGEVAAKYAEVVTEFQAVIG
jgi:hypothetical protein